MSNTLTVPIHLDALVLKGERTGIEPMADFSRLPYFDGTRDVNPDIANISEEVLSQPFQDRGFQLKPGVHLHWALPDGLTRGVRDISQSAQNTGDQKSILSFPIVPNRWLVTRTHVGEQKKQWVIESDYLYPPAQEFQFSGISYPYSDKTHPQPFRYMGRTIPFAAWVADNNSQNPSQYLDPQHPLTAVGYGEPTFAAFYPNCHSVFGLYDDQPPSDLNGVQYDVLGWYNDPTQDCLQSGTFKKAIATAKTARDKYQALEEYYGWSVEQPADQSNASFPQQTICYAHLTFKVNPSNPLINTLTENKEVDIAIGNTSTEALSAYLANKFEGISPHLEDQLEALHLADRLDGQKLDIGFKFQEARHEKEFTAVSGGTIWTIRPESTAPAIANGTIEQTQVTLPKELAHLLNQLNIQQQAYDRDCDEIASMRKQLFADWYKYMLCAYPPTDSRDDYPNLDQVRYFVEKNSLLPLQRRTVRNKALRWQCQQAATNLRQKVTALVFPDIPKNTVYALKTIAAPRYWLPNEPVILIADKTVKHTLRHGHDGRLNKDGLLECQTIQLDQAIAQQFDTIRQAITSVKPSDDTEQIGFSIWTEQPWHPFLLEWEVEVLPIKGKYGGEGIDPSSPHPLTRNYDPDCIQENYHLAEDAVDLAIKPGQETLVKEANVYVGRSILTPHAQIQLKQQIDEFLEKELLSDYYNAKSIDASERTNDYFDRHRGDIIEWYSAPDTKKNPVTDQILKIDAEIDTDFCSLAQSLGGFNEALLMHKQTLQLPIQDTLGFSDYQPFTEAVKQAVASANQVAPQPHNDFNPIRTGILKILQLRLIDTFGQVQTLNFKDEQVITTDTMTTPGSPHLVVLPPRLIQPARLNFRWLSADQALISGFTFANTNGHSAPVSSTNSTSSWATDEAEMNDHPATTPICGWLLPNNLDNSLMIYEAQGQALGSITQDCQWFPAPGRSTIMVEEIAKVNVHLHQLIIHIINQGTDFLDKFLTGVENVLDDINPENSAQHEAIALLIGRPIAIVRARLDLEVQGLPAFDQGWNTFRQEVECEFKGNADKMNSCLCCIKNPQTGVETILRETENFTKVKFPIRVGEHQQLNDGLVGFWQEQDGVYQNEVFYLNDSMEDAHVSPADHPNIYYYADAPHLVQSIDSDPIVLTMLVDPRGSVHATSGVLPTKSIRIPPDQFVEALRKIEVTFLSAPILTSRGSINLSLPTEPGYGWSWVEKNNGVWHTEREIETVNPQATFSAQQEIREGWIRLTQDGE